MPWLALLALGGVAGMGYAGYSFLFDGGAVEGPEETVPLGRGAPLAPGLKTAHSGIKVDGLQVVFATKMRIECDRTLVPELVITSGWRTDSSQAQVMIDYLERYGKDKFVGLYGKAATKLMQIGVMTREAWTPVVTECYNTGLLKRKGHTTGKALDFRSTVKDSAEELEIIRAAKKVGALKAYNDGPCVHVDLP